MKKLFGMTLTCIGVVGLTYAASPTISSGTTVTIGDMASKANPHPVIQKSVDFTWDYSKKGSVYQGASCTVSVPKYTIGNTTLTPHNVVVNVAHPGITVTKAGIPSVIKLTDNKKAVTFHFDGYWSSSSSGAFGMDIHYAKNPRLTFNYAGDPYVKVNVKCS